jgi:rSAM/selenodomain-associated transferase 2
MISIIIPVLNEEQTLPVLLTALCKMLKDDHDHEILVCDGGSSDRTGETATEYGAKLISCRHRGRSSQMHEGAQAASGDILYFLHADTIPPGNFHHAIRTAVSNGAESGCFRLKFDSSHPLLGFYSWFTRFRTRFLRFGDQSLFVTKNAYRETGGFCQKHDIMEDFEMAGRLMKLTRFILLEESVTTSSRKYRENGVFRLQLLFTVIYLMYLAGVSQGVLTQFYKTRIH